MNINVNVNEFLENFFSEGFGILGTLSVLAVFFIVSLLLVSILIYIFSSIGLMKLAKSNNVKNSWLAFLPVGSSYILGKLGFEIYPNEKEKNSNYTWILMGLAIANIVLFDDLQKLASVGIIVFSILAYNKIYKYIIPHKSTKYTILSFFFGGIPFFWNENLIIPKEEIIKDADIINETKSENENKNEEEVKEVKKAPKSNPMNYCPKCGNKLGKDNNFCPGCGYKVK